MGAATIAAARGLQDSLIKTMGRWESSAYTLYHTDAKGNTHISGWLSDYQTIKLLDRLVSLFVHTYVYHFLISRIITWAWVGGTCRTGPPWAGGQASHSSHPSLSAYPEVGGAVGCGQQPLPTAHPPTQGNAMPLVGEAGGGGGGGGGGGCHGT